MTEAQKPAPSRLLRWVAAIGFGVPLALVMFAASPLGPNFFYVLAGIPALLFLWVIAGLIALIVSIRSAMRREWRRCVLAAIEPRMARKYLRSAEQLVEFAHTQHACTSERGFIRGVGAG